MSHSNTPNHPAATPASETVINQDLEQKVARLVVDALLRCGLDPSQCEVVPAESPASGTPGQSASPSVPDASEGKADVLAIETNVISVGLLSSLSIGGREIQVSRNAVVTPAAKDWLREKKIQWSRRAHQTGGVSAETDVNTPTLVATTWVYDSENPENVSGFSKQLAMRGISTTPLQTPPSTTEPMGVGIILSALPAIDVDQWGRQRGFRVACVDSPTQISAIETAIAPQIWILDKSRVPFHGRVALAAQCIRATSIQTTNDNTTNDSPHSGKVVR